MWIGFSKTLVSHCSEKERKTLTDMTEYSHTEVLLGEKHSVDSKSICDHTHGTVCQYSQSHTVNVADVKRLCS